MIVNACELVLSKIGQMPDGRFFGALSDALSDALVDGVAVIAVIAAVTYLVRLAILKDRVDYKP